MLDFCANVSTLFQELPFADRFAEAARLGFSGVEISLHDEAQLEDLERESRRWQLTTVALDLPAASAEPNGYGLACQPEGVPVFRNRVSRLIDHAAVVGCRLVTCVAGPIPKGEEHMAERQTLIDNVRYASRRAHQEGIRILLNLDATLDAVTLIDAAGTRNVALLCDVPRRHALGEPVEPMIARHLSRIGHLRSASRPRAEAMDAPPIDYERLFGFINDIGHRGWVGLGSVESLEAGLAWMSRHGSSRVLARWGIPLQAFRAITA